MSNNRDDMAHRRAFLRTSASLTIGGILCAAAERLAIAEESLPKGEIPQSIILLWLSGGPSQLETFDPHDNTKIAGGTRSISTSVKGIRIADNLPRLAEEMGSVTLLRSMTSREADHLRASYLGMTGYSPEASIIHPAIGAVCAHELPETSGSLPPYISILPNLPYVPAVALRPFRPGRGGYLGNEYDAYCIGDPASPLHGVHSRISSERQVKRLSDVAFLDRNFSSSRPETSMETNHFRLVQRAKSFMTSEQLSAFDIRQEPSSIVAEYGDTYFGRGCLAARRLIEAGVRCVEVVLEDWDSHSNNHAEHRRLCSILDPAFSSLIKDLRRRDLLDRTIVICAGEFGRTPDINVLGGRDHWTKGFSIALAGGGLGRGIALGETDPVGSGKLDTPLRFNDVYATVLTALGIDPKAELEAPNGRPIKLSDGNPISALLS